jgi:hypothetical protein
MGINEKRNRIYGRNGRIPVCLLSCSWFACAYKRFCRLDVRDFYSFFYDTDIVDTSAFYQTNQKNQLGGKL